MLQNLANVEQNYGLNDDSLLATLVYTALGILVMIVALALINAIFRLNLRDELIRDNNIAYGVAIAGFAIAIAIIIAGTITS